jgi:hypothetical protein
MMQNFGKFGRDKERKIPESFESPNPKCRGHPSRHPYLLILNGKWELLEP